MEIMQRKIAKVKGVVRREQIVQAALRIVGAKGVSSLTTAAIARGVGISEANLYRHFKNKDEILFEMGKGIGDAIRKNLETAVRSSLQPLRKLKQAFLLHLEFIEKNEGIPRLGFSEELHSSNAKLQKEFLKNIEVYAAGVEGLIGECQLSGTVRRDIDARLSAVMLIGMAQVAVMRWSLSGFAFSLRSEGVKLWKNYEKCIMPMRSKETVK